MNKEFERCCTFLAEMMEKYGLEVLCDIAVELQFDPEICVMMQKEKDFGMRLMRRDFWSGFWKRHRDYRYPARVGCDTYFRAFKKKKDIKFKKKKDIKND